MISNFFAEWEAPERGEPERVAVSCCPICHEPADKTMDRPDDQTWNWCEGCRLDWLDGTAGKKVLRALGRRGKMAAIEARKAYEDAKKARIQAQIESRELVPAREFAEFRERVAVICGLIERVGPDIASVGNPENPLLAIRAWADWLQNRLNPQVQELMAAEVLRAAGEEGEEVKSEV